MTRALSIENLWVMYDGTPALESISFQVERGEKLAIVGPNGAGKSTLFRAIIGLLPIARGTCRLGDDGQRSEVGYLPQRSNVDWRFPVTVFDVVMMGRVSKIGWLRWYSGRDRRIVMDCLAQVGMAEYADRQIGQLSGGQQQRVFIARALAQEATIFLMDEPLTGVDAPSQEAILTLLDRLSADGMTILVSTHDLNLAVERFDRIALLNRRLIAFGAPRQVITPEALRQAYGGQAVWQGDNYVMVMGDIQCCGGTITHSEERGNDRLD